jgi:DNA primase
MLRQPTEVDARALLLSTGVWFQDKGDYFQIKCPYHNEKKPSAALYKDRWLFKCFACGETRGFAKFYEDLKHEPWNKHGDFSLKTYHREFESLTDRQREVYEIIEGKVTSVYDNAKALEYCRSRNIDDKFMQFFEFQATDLCKFKPQLDKDKKPIRSALWKDRLLISINLAGKPYSLEGRDYTRQQFPKCLYPRGCKTDICFNQDNLNKDDLLIVCEGLMDIHKIWTHITENVTCTFGVSLTEGQKKFLESASNLILYVDDDSAGHNSVNIFEKFMQRDFKVAVTKGKDPGDATVQEAEFAIKNSIMWVDWMLNEIDVFEKSGFISLKSGK